MAKVHAPGSTVFLLALQVMALQPLAACASQAAASPHAPASAFRSAPDSLARNATRTRVPSGAWAADVAPRLDELERSLDSAGARRAQEAANRSALSTQWWREVVTLPRPAVRR